MDRSLIPYQLIGFGSRTKREGGSSSSGSGSSRLAVCGGFLQRWCGVPFMTPDVLMRSYVGRSTIRYMRHYHHHHLNSGSRDRRDPGSRREDNREQWRCVVHMIAVSKARFYISGEDKTCLVTKFQILCHIESFSTCIEY